MRPVLTAVLAITMIGCGAEDQAEANKNRFVLDPVLALQPSAEHPFSTIRQVAESAEGRILIVDAQTPGLLLFRQDGSFDQFEGGRGDGPGEFQSVFRAGFLGEIPWGVDARRRSTQLFDEPVQTVAPPAELASGIAFQMLPSSVLFATQGEASITIHAQSSERLSPVVELDSSERMWRIIPGGSSSLTQPFAHYPLLKGWPGGLVVVRRGNLTERSFGYAVAWVSDDGSTEELEIPTEPTPITDAEIEEALDPLRSSSLPERLVQIGQFESVAEVIESARSQLVIPDHLPPVRSGWSGLEASSVLVSPTGDVWVQRWTSDEALWDVVTREGRGGTVVVPESVRLHAVGDGYAWGVTRDDFDVPTVTRYQLVRDSGDSGITPASSTRAPPS